MENNWSRTRNKSFFIELCNQWFRAPSISWDNILISFIRPVRKKRRIAIVMHECDNSGTFNNIMRISILFPEPGVSRPPRDILCEQSKYVKRSSVVNFPSTRRNYVKSNHVGLSVRLFGNLPAIATSRRAVGRSIYEFNSLIYSGLAKR